MLNRFRLKARKKARARTRHTSSSSSSVPTDSPVALSHTPPLTDESTGPDPDASPRISKESEVPDNPGAYSLHLPLGSVDLPIEIGAATSAGIEVIVDEGGEGLPIRTRKVNQDCFSVVPKFGGAEDSVLMAVYDGHGQHGREAGRAARQVIPKVMENAAAEHAMRVGGGLLRDALPAEERRRAYARLFVKGFKEAEHALWDEERDIIHEYSGTTGTCVWMDGDELYVAWVGDSRCLLGRRREGGYAEAIDLTWDQKPTRDDEKKRVRGAGGRVTRWKKNVGPQRVWLPDEWVPGLAMTRSIGDTCLSKYGVVPTPEVTITKLGNDEWFLVVASDGVWEFMSSAEVAAFIGREKERGAGAEEAARQLVKEANRRWAMNETVVDDTTVIVVYVEKQMESRKGVGFRGSVKEKLGIARKAEVGMNFGEGKPWLIGRNGRLMAFDARNHTEDGEMMNMEQRDLCE